MVEAERALQHRTELPMPPSSCTQSCQYQYPHIYERSLEKLKIENQSVVYSAQGLHRFLDLLFPVVVQILDLLRDLLEQYLGENPQQCPRNVQRGENVTVLIWSLREEFGLELVGELKILVLVLA